jgi:ribonuclease-3
LQHAHSASSQSSHTQLAQPAEHITAARFSRSDLFSSLTAQLGITLKPELLELAFTHRSFAYESGAKETNERLEFLGDSVLGLIVTEELYLRYPDLDESRLSPLRSGIVNMRALADIARTLELGKYIRLGKGEEVTGGRDKNSLLADALEALIGAIYLECGFATTTTVVRTLINETLESAMAKGAGLDGKTALQELVSSLGKGTLEYLVTEEGPDHDKSFTAVAMVSGEAVAQGIGKSKREAEQSAARSAYEILATLK